MQHINEILMTGGSTFLSLPEMSTKLTADVFKTMFEHIYPVLLKNTAV